MVTQYPDIVEVFTHPEYVQGESGNFVQNGSGETFSSPCRAEPAGSNPVIKGVDGNDYVYSWIIYMPRTNIAFEFGRNVKITKADGGIHEGSLKRPYNGQLNSRLWV